MRFALMNETVNEQGLVLARSRKANYGWCARQGADRFFFGGGKFPARPVRGST